MNCTGRRSLAVTSLVVVSITGLSAIASAPEPFGFTPTGGPLAHSEVPGLADTTPEVCAECHREVAEEWESSMHATSFRDPIFLAELQDTTDTAACIACHAPLAGDSATAREGRAHGVACAACHVREGTVLSAESPRGESPHPVRVVPTLRDSTFCGGCHDFEFAPTRASGPAPGAPEPPLQGTLREWASSPAAERGASCVDCHMPSVTRSDGRPGRSHRVLGLRDEAFMHASLRVATSLVREGDEWVVRITLDAEAAGHAVPTGDRFRSLRITVRNASGTARRSLTRRLGFSGRGASRRLHDRRDDRVRPGSPRTLTFRLRYDESAVRFDVELLRLNESVARARGLAPHQILVPIASGEIPRP